VGPAAAEPLRSGAEDARIVFISERASERVFVMNADGSGEAPVRAPDPRAFGPSWSPDGTEIAFTGWSGQSDARPWIMERDGENPRPVRILGSLELSAPDPDWSPNGRRLVFSRWWDLYIVNRDGTEGRRLTRSNRADDAEPAWSPTGRWIAFERNGLVALIRPNGEGVRLLGVGSEPDWSPSGKRLVFVVRDHRGRGDIYTMRADGTDRRRLTSGRKSESGPAWSPGGGRIAFARGRPFLRAGSLWIMARDGTDARRLARNASEPSWAPRGQVLAFTRSRAFDPEDAFSLAPTIFTMRADGTEITRLLSPEVDRDVDGSPDGTKIAYTSIRPFSTSGVYVADADGANESFLHAGAEPDWSPDGSQVLLRDGESVYVVDADGSDPTELPDPVGHPGPTRAWRWHPDGLRVSFVGSDGCNGGFTMALDGTQVTRVTQCGPWVEEFDWHPSGASLVFSGFECEDCDESMIFRADVPAGEPTAISTGSEWDAGPRVSPDGSTVVFFRYVPVYGGAVWSVPVAGGAETRLTSSDRDFWPAWLPVPAP
jgi:TolB protein